MSRSVLALTAVTALGFGACAYLFNALQNERAMTAELRERVTALQSEVGKHVLPSVPAAAAPAAPAQLVAPPGPSSPRTTGSLAANRPASSSVNAGVPLPRDARAVRVAMERQQALLKDPDYRAAMLEQQKLSLRQSYPDLQAALDLTADQFERFVDLLAEQQLAAMENRPMMRGDQASMEEWRQRMLQQQRDSESAIAAELGAGGLEKWKDYQASLGARYQVRNMRSQLEAAGVPLREEQLDSLVSALRGTEQSSNLAIRMMPRPGNGPLSAADRLQWMEQSAQRAEVQAQKQLEAVRPYLTSQQFEQFEKIQAQQEKIKQASMRVMQAQLAAAAQAEARGEVPPQNDGAAVFMGAGAPGAYFVNGPNVITGTFGNSVVPLEPPPPLAKKRRP